MKIEELFTRLRKFLGGPCRKCVQSAAVANAERQLRQRWELQCEYALERADELETRIETQSTTIGELMQENEQLELRLQAAQRAEPKGEIGMSSEITVKDLSVRFSKLTPQCVLAMMVVRSIYDTALTNEELAKFPFVITSANDGKHSTASLHYSGNAFDLRIWAFKENPAALRAFASRCAAALGRDFDVVLESDHLHVEYDPK